MKNKFFFLSLIFTSIILMSACKKDDETGPKASAFIQIDQSKNEPVTQKTDPNNLGWVNSRFFATTTLDLTQKTGSTETFTQVNLIYLIPNASNEENEAAAKAFFESIGEGKTVTSKINGENSMLHNQSAGFMLSGSIAATTGVWDYGYNLMDDVALEIRKSKGKIQFAVASPVELYFGKRAGAGTDTYPSFNADLLFTLHIPM